MSPREIAVPATKPATEWLFDRPRQKVSPQELHARVQMRMVVALMAWADATGSGRVGTEWEFRLTPPLEPTRVLVPDISYLSYDRPGYEHDEAAQIPYMAPDVAIEILSPDKRLADIREKTRVYLACGSAVVIIDPVAQTFEIFDAEETRTLSRGEVFAHASLPSFRLTVGSVFEKAQPKKR